MKQKTFKLKRTIFRVLIFALIGIVFGLCIYNINASFVLGNKLPMPFGIGSSVVLSGSMEPTLSVNDLIIVKKTDEFYDKQIIVYQDGKSLTVHRIIKIEGDEITTQGDANNVADDPITKEMVKGEVVAVIPFVGAIINFLKQPIVVIILLGVSIWLLEGSFKKEKEKENSELESLKSEIQELTEELKNNKEAGYNAKKD